MKRIKIRLVNLIIIIVSIIAIVIALIWGINKLKKKNDVELEEVNKTAFFFIICS